MRELGFGQAIEVGDQAIQFGAQTGAFGGVGCAVAVGFQADLQSKIVEFRGGANKESRAIGYSFEASIRFRDVRGLCSINEMKIHVGRNF